MNPTSAEARGALAEADVDRPIAEGPQKTISTYNLHEELVFAEAPRKQNQLANHPRKLKLWSRKQHGRQVGLEENDIGVFATAQTNRSNTKPGFLGGVLNNDGKEIQFFLPSLKVIFL